VDPTRYFEEHWREIDPERLDRYELMFAWRPEHGVLIAPARIEAGQTVLDFGSGPGQLAVELAGRVGAGGHVHGVDLNADFVARSTQRAAEAGLAERITFHHVTGNELPLEGGSIDRVICKNVLEYVPDLDATLRELRRVQPEGALLHAIDSDWGFVVVEPWSPEAVTEFFGAAAHAFREPNIGRKLRAALVRAGYRDIQVAMQPIMDTSGLTQILLQNMASYVREFETLPVARVEELLGQAREAVDRGEYLFVLPQFLITGTA
jgi:arsenite methyltransferase